MAAPAAPITPDELKKLDIRDPTFNVSWLEPDIILGVNVLPELEIREIRRLQRGYVLSSSLIGSFIYGQSKSSNPPQEGHACLVISNFMEREHDEDPPDAEVKNFFSLDGMGINQASLDFNADVHVQQSFNETVFHDGERFQVTLPWIEDRKQDLRDNFGLALGRLTSLHRMVNQRDPSLFQKFRETIEEQKERGIIEVLDNPFEEGESSCPIHYIPWQIVFKKESSFTKMRLVHAANAKAGKNARSLNECLFKGPDLNVSLVSMLLNARRHNILTTCDIEKAFLMVGINEKDRNCLRFLWLKDTDRPPSRNNVQICRFKRVPFGVVCSPYLLQATI